MTRTTSTPVRIDCAARSSSHAQAWPVALVWDLASRVCLRCAADNGTDTPNGTPNGTPADIPVAIEVLITPDEGKSCATVSLCFVLNSGARHELETRSGVRAVWLREDGFEHLDAEGVVSCTFRTADTSRPVFARCPLLEQAGIPAGSYSLRSRGD
ncbi:MAG: hypothetical protein Q9O74_03585 [Planctomycetota bacterium]|nr:hypothetical protein [Planctomycetota bacterium]